MVKDFALTIGGWGGTAIRITTKDGVLTYYRKPWSWLSQEDEEKALRQQEFNTWLDEQTEESLASATRENTEKEVDERVKNKFIKTITPSEAAWRTFEDTVSGLSPQQWATRYKDPHIPDGTAWSFLVVTDAWTLNSGGLNAFPLSGRIDDVELYNAFIRAVEALIGEKL
jgi:hypothetical protein